MKDEIGIPLNELLHELDAAVSASEQSFNRLLDDTKKVDRYKNLHENAIKRIREFRKLLAVNLPKDFQIIKKEAT